MIRLHLFISCLCAAIVLLAVAPVHASIVGQKRFLPLNVNAQKQRSAIIVPAERVREAAPAPSQGMMPLRRAGFMPLRRDVHTIRQGLQRRNASLADQRRHASGRHQAAAEQSPAPIRTAAAHGRAQRSVVMPPAAAMAANSKDEAIMQLFGAPELDASHPFLK